MTLPVLLSCFTATIPDGSAVFLGAVLLALHTHAHIWAGSACGLARDVEGTDLSALDWFYELEACRERQSSASPSIASTPHGGGCPPERQASSKIEFGQSSRAFAGRLCCVPTAWWGSGVTATSCCGRWPKTSTRSVALQTALNRTDLGAYSTSPYSYLRDDPALDL